MDKTGGVKAPPSRGSGSMEPEIDCIWVNLKNISPPFFKFISVYIKMSFKQLENHSQLLCGCDSENERLLLCQFDV